MPTSFSIRKLARTQPTVDLKPVLMLLLTSSRTSDPLHV